MEPSAPADAPGRLGLIRALADLLAPPRCLACRHRGVTPWCAGCREEVRALPQGCPRCAAPRGAAHACWPQDAPIDAVTAAYDYNGVVAAAIATAKIAGAHAAWPSLAAPLLDRLATQPPEVDAVTWVTTPAARIRQRGTDHACRLAALVAGRLGLPCTRLLTARGTSGDRDRYTAIRSLPGTDLLLVDDILTTGATAWRAGAGLRAAGAGRLHLAVLARAGTHTLGAASARCDLSRVQ